MPFDFKEKVARAMPAITLRDSLQDEAEQSIRDCIADLLPALPGLSIPVPSRKELSGVPLFALDAELWLMPNGEIVLVQNPHCTMFTPEGMAARFTVYGFLKGLDVSVERRIAEVKAQGEDYQRGIAYRAEQKKRRPPQSGN